MDIRELKAMDVAKLIELAADRAPLIDQAQSVNVFLAADVHKRDLHQIHFQAWKQGLKSLYYCRSLSIQRADKVSEKATSAAFTIPHHGQVNSQDGPAIRATESNSPANPAEDTRYDECLSCQ